MQNIDKNEKKIKIDLFTTNFVKIGEVEVTKTIRR